MHEPGFFARCAKFLSHDCGAFAQFVKYGAVGVLSAIVQSVVFYALASTCLECLEADDIAVRFLGLRAVEIGRFARAVRFALATAAGFVVANIFCWLMNRLFVFRPGKFRWWKELGMFFGAAALAMIIATLLGSALIRYFGLMTSLAVIVEIIVSFLVNFFARKFFIFKG